MRTRSVSGSVLHWLTVDSVTVFIYIIYAHDGMKLAPLAPTPLAYAFFIQFIYSWCIDLSKCRASQHDKATTTSTLECDNISKQQYALFLTVNCQSALAKYRCFDLKSGSCKRLGSAWLIEQLHGGPPGGPPGKSSSHVGGRCQSKKTNGKGGNYRIKRQTLNAAAATFKSKVWIRARFHRHQVATRMVKDFALCQCLSTRLLR